MHIEHESMADHISCLKSERLGAEFMVSLSEQDKGSLP